MKRIALFLDGTWNTVDSKTNVYRLSRAVLSNASGVAQHVFYDQGVGTKRFEWLRGGALGYGLGANVVEAYAWLLREYEPGDEIYIFGFSRGAYTARSLAGMIAKCGLLQRDAVLGPEGLFHRYQLSASVRPIYELEWIRSQGGDLTAEEQTLLTSSRRIPIKMIAVWDTVGALGVPFGNIPGLSRTEYQFHHTRLSNLYEHAYHALAIDEHREAFEPTLWTRFIPKIPDPLPPVPGRKPIVEQRWFVGAHADVGGGNPTSLPDIPLAWLASKASAAGLALNGPIIVPPAAEMGPITDSFASFMFGIYRIAKGGLRFTRIIQADPVEKQTGTVETVAETIDGSVFDRFRADRTYRPAALMAWADKRAVDPGHLHGAVDASTLARIV